MADEDKDLNDGAGAGDGAGDGGNGAAGDGSGNAGDGGQGGGYKGKPEPQVPLSRLREEVDKREKLEKEIADLRGKNALDEKQKLKQQLEEIKKEEEEAEEKAEKELTAKLDDLHKIHGDFNKENLLKIIEDYGCYNQDGTVRWDKAMELYNRLGGKPNAPAQKKKMPTGDRTNDGVKKEPFDPSKKSMWEIAEDAKRELNQ